MNNRFSWLPAPLLLFLLCGTAWPADSAPNSPAHAARSDMMCGPASLWYAAKACGIDVTVDDLCKYAGTEPVNGTSMRGILQAADHAGLQATVVETNADYLLNNLPICILILDRNTHFSYFNSISKGKIILLDNRGQQSVTLSQFNKRWGGLAILIRRKGDAGIAAPRVGANNYVLWLGASLAMLGLAIVIQTRVRRTHSAGAGPKPGNS